MLLNAYQEHVTKYLEPVREAHLLAPPLRRVQAAPLLVLLPRRLRPTGSPSDDHHLACLDAARCHGPFRRDCADPFLQGRQSLAAHWSAVFGRLASRSRGAGRKVEVLRRLCSTGAGGAAEIALCDLKRHACRQMLSIWRRAQDMRSADLVAEVFSLTSIFCATVKRRQGENCSYRQAEFILVIDAYIGHKGFAVTASYLPSESINPCHTGEVSPVSTRNLQGVDPSEYTAPGALAEGLEDGGRAKSRRRAKIGYPHIVQSETP